MDVLLRKKTPEELEQSIINLVTEIVILKSQLKKAQELVEKWRRVEILANAEQVAIKMAHHKCADELDETLK